MRFFPTIGHHFHLVLFAHLYKKCVMCAGICHLLEVFKGLSGHTLHVLLSVPFQHS